MSDTTTVAVPPPPDRTPLDKLLQIREELVGYSFEREPVIDGILTGLVAGHHALLIGPPGTDKSRLIRALCHRIDGARYFGRLLTKFTHPDELFGPLDVMELERGHYRRVTMGRLPEAEIAFLDEVFKSGSAILNTLLQLMNERTFNDGSEEKVVPLRMLVGASNELPNPEDGLEAFADRFPLRFRVQYLQQDDAFDAMLALAPDGAREAPQVTMIGLGEIDQLRQISRTVDVPLFVRNQLATLRKQLNKDGVVVSDRRWRQALDILRANALIARRPTVDVSDFLAIIPCLWNEPGHIDTVTKAVQKLPGYVTVQLRRIGMAVQSVQNAVHTRATPWLEARTKLSGLRYEVDRILAHVDPATKTTAEQEAKAIRQAIVQITRDMRTAAERQALARRVSTTRTGASAPGALEPPPSGTVVQLEDVADGDLELIIEEALRESDALGDGDLDIEIVEPPRGPGRGRPS